MAHAISEESPATFSEKLAAYICSESLINIDRRCIEHAKQRLVYHLGIAFQGLKSSDPEVLRAIEIARDLSDGGGRSSVIGLPHRVTVSDAVFANCQMMRSFGRDDVILETGVHPGLMIFPVAWSLAERHQSTGAEFLIDHRRLRNDGKVRVLVLDARFSATRHDALRYIRRRYDCVKTRWSCRRSNKWRATH